MRCTLIPFPCPDDPQGCYTEAECHWAPNFDFSQPQIFSLTGPEGQSLMGNPLREQQAVTFIRDHGAMHDARFEMSPR